MMISSRLRIAAATLAGLIALQFPAHADPSSAPRSCDILKAAHVETVTGPVDQYIPMMDRNKDGVSYSMCAFAGKDGKHYGMMIHHNFSPSPDMTAEKNRADTIEKLKQVKGRADGLTTPDIGEAALWVPKKMMLSVWLDHGHTELLFIGDETTPDAATHIAIAQKVVAQLAR